MSFLRCALALLASHAGLVAAATRTWPGAAPCAASLQACVDAAADGDRIEIATDEPITQNLAMRGRRLTLTAAAGYAPRFVGARVTADDGSGVGEIELRLSRLRFEDGAVIVSHQGPGNAVFDLRELDIVGTPGVDSVHGISVVANAGTVDVALYDNRIRGRPASPNSGLIRLAAQGGTLNASAYYNRLASLSAEPVNGAGIYVDYSFDSAAGTVKLHGNEVRGSFSRAGIFLSEGSISAESASYSARVYSNVVVGNGLGKGIVAMPKDGSIDVQLINNTVTRMQTGISAERWSGGTSAAVTGLVVNNLVRAGEAISAGVGVAADLGNDYNLFDGAIVNVTPGAHTLTAPAALVSDEYPRPRADSPAIDAADSGLLGLGLIVNRLPVTDADGLRRIKNATGSGPDKADVGAYERGDLHFVHTATAANTAAHVSTIDHAAANARPDADLLLTPNFDGGDNPPITFDRPLGVRYSDSRWTVFDQGLAAIPEYVDFDVFVPAPGSGVFRHVADADNTADWFSQFDDGSVNGLPDRIVLVTQNFSAGPVHNAHPVGVFHFSFGGPGAWMVANLDMTDLPPDAGFNVYAQEPSPNAFRVTAGPANTLGSALILDHPLLDGVPCAQPMVTRVFDGNPVPRHFDIDYGSDKWRIFAYDGMPDGAQFHVLVNPAQVFECRDRLFADDFD